VQRTVARRSATLFPIAAGCGYLPIRSFRAADATELGPPALRPEDPLHEPGHAEADVGLVQRDGRPRSQNRDALQLLGRGSVQSLEHVPRKAEQHVRIEYDHDAIAGGVLVGFTGYGSLAMCRATALDCSVDLIIRVALTSLP